MERVCVEPICQNVPIVIDYTIIIIPFLILDYFAVRFHKLVVKSLHLGTRPEDVGVQVGIDGDGHAEWMAEVRVHESEGERAAAGAARSGRLIAALSLTRSFSVAWCDRVPIKS